MPKQNLTDRGLRALQPAEQGRRYELMDTQVPWLGVRINHRAKTSKNDYPGGQFIYVGIFKRGGNPARRTLGQVGVMTLAEAREKALHWRKLIQTGKDPAEEEARQRRSEARRREVTFEAVAEDFIQEKLSEERKGREVARDIRRDLISRLGPRPIADIERIDLRDIIKAKRHEAPAQARNLLGYAKRLFSWAVDQEVYGIASSPCAEIRAREIIGERSISDRCLSGDELFALWRVASRQPYPYRQIYQLLLLNGLRLNEVADASWDEFDFRKREWTIPASRMKGKNGKAKPHLVPLTDETLQILGTLPLHRFGSFLFSCRSGETSVWMGTKVKARIDRAMLQVLRALARKRGDNPARVKLPDWVNHDIRRTVRTNLSSLRNAQGVRIVEEVAEAVLAHARPGIVGVYDRHTYADEKFEALGLWAAKLQELVTGGALDPPKAVIIPYRRRA